MPIILLTLCMLGIIFKINCLSKIFRNTIRLLNGLDPDQLVQNCSQWLTTDSKSRRNTVACKNNDNFFVLSLETGRFKNCHIVDAADAAVAS